MKIILTIVMLLSLTLNAWAVDFSTLNKESMDVFVKLLPEYKELLKKLDVEYEEDAPVNMAMEYKADIDKLFGRYGITWEEFPLMMQKVSLGFASLQMKKSGMPPEMMNMMGEYKDFVSEQELKVLDQYSETVEKILSEE